ncbi:MAG: hypothetical protein QXL94_05370 [Candidatus Parvarchaeum sp.]
MNNTEFMKWIRNNNIEKHVVIKVKRYEDIAFRYGFVEYLDKNNFIFRDIHNDTTYRINYSDIMKLEKFE